MMQQFNNVHHATSRCIFISVKCKQISDASKSTMARQNTEFQKFSSSQFLGESWRERRFRALSVIQPLSPKWSGSWPTLLLNITVAVVVVVLLLLFLLLLLLLLLPLQVKQQWTEPLNITDNCSQLVKLPNLVGWYYSQTIASVQQSNAIFFAF